MNWFKIYNPKAKEWRQQHEAQGLYGPLVAFTQDESCAGFWSESEIKYMTIPAGSELIVFSPTRHDIRYREWF